MVGGSGGIPDFSEGCFLKANHSKNATEACGKLLESVGGVRGSRGPPGVPRVERPFLQGSPGLRGHFSRGPQG